jgi:hypothetical protein
MISRRNIGLQSGISFADLKTKGVLELRYLISRIDACSLNGYSNSFQRKEFGKNCFAISTYEAKIFLKFKQSPLILPFGRDSWELRMFFLNEDHS